MGGGSLFWELVCRKCKSKNDRKVDDPQCGVVGHACAAGTGGGEEEDIETDEVQEACYNCGVRFCTPELVAGFVKGKRLAIDLSGWVVQCDNQSSNSGVTIPAKLRETLYLRNIFYRALRIASTKFGGALPVFISDPGLGTQDTALKNSTRILRARLMRGSHPLSESELESIVSKLGSKPLRRNSLFMHKCNTCLEMFRLMGFPTAIAPGEAEALCAQLTAEGLADAVVSQVLSLLFALLVKNTATKVQMLTCW